MFVLDKGIRDCTFGIAYRDSYFNDRTQAQISFPEDKNKYTSFFSGADYFEGWWVSSGGSGNYRMYWNRMADGTMISSRCMPVRFEFSATKGTSTNVLEEWATVNNDSHTDVGNNPAWDNYSTATISGAQYKCGIARLGVGSQYEADKYITSVGLDEFEFPVTPVMGGIEIYDAYGSHNSISGSYEPRYIFNNNVGTGSIRDSSEMTFLVVAYPTGSVPTLTPVENNIGTIFEPQQVSVQVSGSPSMTATLDGTTPVTPQVSSGQVTVNLQDVWDTVGYGKHEIVITATQNGYKTGSRITFDKSASSVIVETKPYVTDSKPVSCRLVSDVVVPSGAVLTQEVTNNGNDENPTWEEYEGGNHVFANNEMASGHWGVAARVSINNSLGTSQAEIRDSLAMGVVFKEAE